MVTGFSVTKSTLQNLNSLYRTKHDEIYDKNEDLLIFELFWVIQVKLRITSELI